MKILSKTLRITKLGARGRQALINTSSKLVLKDDNPIFAVTHSQFYTPWYCVVVFSRGISLFCRRHHILRVAVPTAPQERLCSPTGLCGKCPWCLGSLDCACWAQRVSKAWMLLAATLGVSAIGASCTGKAKAKVRHECSSLGEPG